MLSGVIRKKRRHSGADETAGLGDDEFHGLEQALAERTVERFKEDAQALLEQMTPENAPRVYSLLEDSAIAAREWTSKLVGHGMKPNGKRGGGPYIDAGYEEPFMSDETWGAKALDQLTSIFGSMGQDQQLSQLVRAIKTAKEGGMDDVAERIQKKLDKLLGDEPTAAPALPEPEENSEPEVIDEIPSGTEAVIQ